MEDNGSFTTYLQHDGCWWPRDIRSHAGILDHECTKALAANETGAKTCLNGSEHIFILFGYDSDKIMISHFSIFIYIIILYYIPTKNVKNRENYTWVLQTEN